MKKSEDNPCPFGPEYQIYWDMRYSLFTKFDQAKVDATGLYTMAPEGFALEIARKVSGSRVLDICSGIGAMSIAFARCGQRVTAVEIDENRVEMAKHNAQLYGVADQIDFLAADITSETTLRNLPTDIDTVHLDPPWGTGPGDYQRRRVIRLEDLKLSGMDLHTLIGKIACREVMMRLPPNFDRSVFNKIAADRIKHVDQSGFLYCYFMNTQRFQFLRIPDSVVKPTQ